MFYRLIEGTLIDFNNLYYLNRILNYRQGLIRVVEIYYYYLEVGILED